LRHARHARAIIGRELLALGFRPLDDQPVDGAGVACDPTIDRDEHFGVAFQPRRERSCPSHPKLNHPSGSLNDRRRHLRARANVGVVDVRIDIPSEVDVVWLATPPLATPEKLWRARQSAGWEVLR
jgi:hypothetical protein